MISRRYETIVGVFVVASLVALLIMVFIIARQEGLFQEYVEYRAIFRNISGLKVGAEVHLAGVTVGNVKAITISREGSILVTFQVIKKYSDRVRHDSQASIGYMGLLGEKSLDITTGSLDKPAIPPEGWVASVEPLDITQMLAKAGPSLENLQKILSNIAILTSTLVGEKGGLTKTLDEFREILKKIDTGKGSLGLLVNDPKLYQETTQTFASGRQLFTDLEQGKGPVGALINDPKLKAQVEKTIAGFETTTANLSKSSADFKDAMGRLPEIAKKLDSFLTDLQKAGKGLPGLVTSGDTALSDLDNTTKAVQKSWLFRGNLPNPREHTIRMDGEAGKD
jgi:phospholipid/cholesterol/gamma-HCH transport system substrate-binding protein